MNLLHFDSDSGEPVEHFDSIGVNITRLIHPSEEPVSAIFMHIAPGGNVGYHQAAIRQLFLVVSGEGWVSGEDQVPQAIKAGQAALWETNEWHESGSETGMMAIVLEGNGIQPKGHLAPH